MTNTLNSNVKEILKLGVQKHKEMKFNDYIPGLSISDFLIIIHWLNYAKIIGDLTYKNLNIDFFNSRFIDNKLLNQVEFRKNEFNNI